MSEHVHQLVLIGELAGEYGGRIPLRWCRDCGAIVGLLVGGAAELIPTFARDRIDPETSKMKFLPVGIRMTASKKKSELALGRTLNELQNRGAKISKLPGT